MAENISGFYSSTCKDVFSGNYSACAIFMKQIKIKATNSIIIVECGV